MISLKTLRKLWRTYMKKDKGYCYLVCSVKDDLPETVVDTPGEIADYLGCCRTSVWKMITQGAVINGCYVEKVLL